MNWKEFKQEAPELATKAEELFDDTGVLLLGTLRKDGSPRISPVEPLIVGDDLYLGMMWKSLKALDLSRDPRCTLHNCITDRLAKHGEFKLHGRAKDIRDGKERRRYCVALEKKIGWAPTEPRFHVFAVAEIESAALFLAEENHRVVRRWRKGRGLDEFRQKP